MGSFASFWVVLLLVAGESVSRDDEEKFTVTDGTIKLCPNKEISSLSHWLSQRSDVRVSLWLLNYTGLERNVWCKEDRDAECRGVPRSITLEGVSTPKKGKYKCVVRKNRKEEYKRGFTLIALRGAASHSNPAPEGSSLSLTCEGWGLPEVQKWEWTNNSVIISGTSKYMNNANLNKLTIRSLEKKSDGGTYKCKPVFQQTEIKHSVFLNHNVTISGSASTGPTVSTLTAGSSTSITKNTTAGGRNKTQSSTTCCYSDPSGSPVPPSTPDPYSDAVVRIVVPVVLIILVLLGIGAFCLIKRKRSQAQDVNSIIANPMDGDGDDPEVNYTTVNLNKLPSSDRQPGPVTEQTLYSQIKVN
ncbi:uncharacterized protein LOC117434101 isoform X2 [Acipenser ruthenus]|uniref:uncharacterized protein LOC117434101 isoform X2 n=1 Tax=Acipenser ruthenus TaxID=7906 RepID=UPI002740B206|nr:uncharacterized protein LOC117434101 isoform X2 [Acipenser ruthenus]